MADAEDGLIAVLMAIITFLTIFGNMFVILGWCTQKSLRSPSNLYISSLAFVDLLVGIFVTSTDIAVQLKSDWIKNRLVCQARIVLIVTLTTVSIFHLIAIAWDRYRTVVDGVQYIQRRSTKSVIQIIIMIWIISIWIALPPVLDWNETQWPENTCRFEGGIAWVIHSTFGAFIFPTFVMIKMYANVYSAIQERLRKRNKLVQDQTSNTVDENTEETVDQIDPKYKRRDNLELPSAKTSPMAQLAEKKLKISLSKERKLIKTLGIIMGAFMICWLPFFILHFFGAVFPNLRSPRLFRLLAFLGHSNSAINPFVYAIYNREYKEAFIKILSCGRK